MTENKPSTYYSSYTGLWPNQWRKPADYRASEPGESEREELLQRKLGTRGWGRFNYFKKEFSGLWGEEGKGKPFSPKAQGAFFKFLQKAEFPEGITPSIFLTSEGHVELSWENSAGKAIQVEFGPKDAEIYLESTGYETKIENTRMNDVVQTACA